MDKRWIEIENLLQNFPEPPTTEVVSTVTQESIDVGVFYINEEGTDKYDPLIMEKMCRLCKGVLGQKNTRLMYADMINNDLTTVVEWQKYSHQILLSKSSKKKKKKSLGPLPSLQMNKWKLEFGLNTTECSLESLYTDSFTIELENIPKKAKKLKKEVKIILPKLNAEEVTLNAHPLTGEITPKNNLTIQVKIEIFLPQEFKNMIIVEVDGLRYFISIHLETESSIFSQPLDKHEFVKDKNYRVPSVLATLRKHLYQNNGLNLEHIFRERGDDNEMKKLKKQFEEGSFKGTNDLHSISNLIKVFFRQMRTGVLNEIRLQSLLKIENSEEYDKLVGQLSKDKADLFFWLIDLLTDVILHQEKNKMSLRNLAIIIAPNLYRAESDQLDDNDPMRGLMISQKITKLIEHQLNKMLTEKQKK
ncbi:rho gtpase-activating protein gaca [Anaeramoeba flamelloides]|uniref:Rho gtpase-activating protein gaca n=1 Tax=Anaeramoeba flamelloides TaxID=1746091 RepID=A0AAV7ZS36_9EUKA|nr:rho gtpase-activating protein gaca [Anaeramoeba flamelloides]